jgi:hypothetical protein
MVTSPAIIPGLRDATPEKVDAFRARDVRLLLAGTGVDPKVQKCLEALAESNHANSKHNMAMANALNQMTDIVASFAVIAENMKKMMHEVPDQVAEATKGLV